ncbi:MAG: branched-chain amino acid ABC transporter permease [Chloroflexi bacterium]|nr:MAG: branched-chain amino acid ABC transporter permease [Chloroflexota bacterium]
MIAGAAPTTAAVRVTRSRRSALWGPIGAVVVVILLATLPYVVYADVTDLLVNAFILLVLASMWNLLAGYCGLISVGQQAYIGVGAYTVLLLAQNGINPYLAIPFAVVVAAAIAVPVSFLVFRLRAEYFAIGTWVVAEVFFFVLVRIRSLGGGTGTSLPGLVLIDPVFRQALTYWSALAVAVAALLATYLLLSSRMGLDLTAIRDNEVAARSAGVRVTWAQRVVYVVSAAGCAAGGALLIISQLNVLASAIFSVGWSAKMIFVALIGGVGSIEGPIVGTAIFTVIQQTMAQFGAWYLILLGSLAVLVAMFLPKGIWGLMSSRLHLQVFPVGYWLHRQDSPSPARGGGQGGGL